MNVASNLKERHNDLIIAINIITSFVHSRIISTETEHMGHVGLNSNKNTAVLLDIMDDHKNLDEVIYDSYEERIRTSSSAVSENRLLIVVKSEV